MTTLTAPPAPFRPAGRAARQPVARVRRAGTGR